MKEARFGSFCLCCHSLNHGFEPCKEDKAAKLSRFVDFRVEEILVRSFIDLVDRLHFGER